MFIYSNWDKICQELSINHNCISADQILDQMGGVSWVVVKHDVEANVDKALILARIEAKYGIRATYYVQANLLKANASKLQEIGFLGHEITYHYDVLDSNDGDYRAAIEEFTSVQNEFLNLGFKVKTVCPHGNPIKIRHGWSSNKDFFRDPLVVKLFPNIFDIVVQLPSIKNSYIYISDAAYSWKLIGNVHNNDINNKGDIILNDMLGFLKNNTKCVIISTHPHRWQNSKIKVIISTQLFKVIRFVARRISKVNFIKKVMSKYYFLAKNI